MDSEWIKYVIGLIAAAVGGSYWRIWQNGQDIGRKADASVVGAALEAQRNTIDALSQRISRRVSREEGDELWRQTNENRDRLAQAVAVSSGLEAELRAMRESQGRIEKMLGELLQGRRDK